MINYHEEVANETTRRWSFVVKRHDISKSGSQDEWNNHCPFIKDIKDLVENIIKDTVNMSIDEFDIRNFVQMRRIIKHIHSTLTKDSKLPPLEDFDVIGDSAGLRVVVTSGISYAVPYNWTLYNDHWSTVSEWYRNSGNIIIRNLIKIAIEQFKQIQSAQQGEI